jgi:hypothetical protein
VLVGYAMINEGSRPFSLVRIARPLVQALQDSAAPHGG